MCEFCPIDSKGECNMCEFCPEDGSYCDRCQDTPEAWPPALTDDLLYAYGKNCGEAVEPLADAINRMQSERGCLDRAQLEALIRGWTAAFVPELETQ